MSELQIGDIVQIDPQHDKRFGGCLMIVSKPMGWGAQGYVTIPHADGPQQAYYRCPNAAMVKVGHAEWTLDE